MDLVGAAGPVDAPQHALPLVIPDQRLGFLVVLLEPVLDHIVDLALKRQTGARGLVSLLTSKLEDCAYQTFCERKGRVTMKMKGDSLDWELR